MKIEMIEDAKDRARFKIDGEDHTLCNLIKDELNQDESVKISTYAIKHPLIGAPRFTVETKKGTSAKDAVLDAAKNVKKKVDKLRKDFKELK